MSSYEPIVSVGLDKNDEIDFRINMSIASWSPEQMQELCRMMPWMIHEMIDVWKRLGPPSKEMAQEAKSEGAR